MSAFLFLHLVKPLFLFLKFTQKNIMAHFENVITREFEYDTQEAAFAAIAPGGEHYDEVQEGYTDADGRQLTKAEIEYLVEVAKWIIRLVFGIPVP